MEYHRRPALSYRKELPKLQLLGLIRGLHYPYLKISLHG
jgi:hypothetical protein